MVNSVSGARLSGNNNVVTVKQKTQQYGRNGLLVGAVLGGIDGYRRTSWIKDNEPSDTFVKKVSTGLENSLSLEDKLEVDKVNDFFAAVAEPSTELSNLRPKIEESKELISAVPVKEKETTAQALDRIFSEENSKDLKTTLRDMQSNTKIDKTVDKNAAKDLINNNIDKNTWKIKKADGTSEDLFKILKKATHKMRVSAAKKHAMAGAVVLGTLGLLVGANTIKSVDDTKKQEESKTATNTQKANIK